MPNFIIIIATIVTFMSLSPARGATPISPTDAYAAVLTDRAILVDVREETEIRETGMAEFAVWLPTTAIDTRGSAYQDALEKWPKELKLIFYCRSGRRSENAADHFAQQGYRTLNAGTFQDWKDAGLPIKTVEILQ